MKRRGKIVASMKSAPRNNVHENRKKNEEQVFNSSCNKASSKKSLFPRVRFVLWKPLTVYYRVLSSNDYTSVA